MWFNRATGRYVWQDPATGMWLVKRPGSPTTLQPMSWRSPVQLGQGVIDTVAEALPTPPGDNVKKLMGWGMLALQFMIISRDMRRLKRRR